MSDRPLPRGINLHTKYVPTTSILCFDPDVTTYHHLPSQLSNCTCKCTYRQQQVSVLARQFNRPMDVTTTDDLEGPDRLRSEDESRMNNMDVTTHRRGSPRDE